MKIKKLMAGVVAAAMAVSTAIVAPLTVSAADVSLSPSNFYLWYADEDSYDASTGTATFTAANHGLAYWIGGSDHSRYIEVQFEYADSTAGTVTAVVEYTDGTTTASEVSSSEASGTLTVPLDTTGKEGGISQVALKNSAAGSLTLVSATIIEDPDAPEIVYNTWAKNDDGKYSITVDANAASEDLTAYLDLTEFTEADFADIISIEVDITADGGGGCIGLNCAENGWTSANWSGTSTAKLDVNGVEAGQNLQVQFWWQPSADGKVTINSVTVTEKIYVDSVTLSAEMLDLTVGEEETLTATVAPDDATAPTVTWSSDAEDVVAVDENGKVTAIKSGTATITATADGKSDTCVVTVTNPVTAISIDETAGILVGGTKELTVTTTPAAPDPYTIVWSSDDTTAATVDANGKVTGVKAGTATITATVDGTTISDTCAVTVTANTVAVTGVTLDQETLDLVKGDTATIKATIAPADATNTDVMWTSTYPEVASVDENGMVTALSSGEAIITVTTDDGSYEDTCVVTVTNPVTAITLDKPSAGLEIDETVTLTATVTPTDADDATVTWTSDKTAVATVDANGNVTAVAAGTATITAKAGDKTATCTITVNEPVDTSAYVYEYDGSPIELTLEVPSWDATQLNGQKNIALSPAGVTMQTTTFAQLKELYSGIQIKDWAIDNITEGADESAVSVSIYIQNGSGWSWNAFNGTSVDFADITAISDSDPIMAIGFQVNYNATGSSFKSGDVIVINGEESGDDESERGEYSDGEWEQLDEADIPELPFGEADAATNFVEIPFAMSATCSDGKLYLYVQCAEETIANAESASVVVRYKDGKALRLTTTCAYSSLTADVKAEEGYLFLAFIIDGVSNVESDALYYGNFSWNTITLN